MFHLVQDLMYHRRSWRHVTLSQMGELYASMMIKSFSMSLIGIFIPVYLYQLGYPLHVIAGYFSAIYAVRIVTDNIAGWLVGEFGPKHIMILSHVFLIIQYLLFATIEEYNWSLALIAPIQIIATGFFYMAYHVSFSKIQSIGKAGSQIGQMYRLVKIASAVGPLLGGYIATITDIRFVLYFAILLIIASAVPLIMSPEPVRKHQHITFHGFPWKKVRRNLLSNMALGADQMSSLFIWPLYVAIFVFVDNVYLGVGFATTIGLVTSILFTKVYGKLIDNKKGNDLLKMASIGQSFMHIIRLFITSSGAVFMFNTINDPISMAVRMTYTKGVYGAASRYEGYRIIFIGALLTSSNIVRASTMGLVALIAYSGNERLALQSVFIFAAITIWMVRFHNYKALR